jgi:hypothetical protein
MMSVKSEITIEKQRGRQVGCNNGTPHANREAGRMASWLRQLGSTKEGYRPRLADQGGANTAAKSGVKIIILKEISGLKGNQEI